MGEFVRFQSTLWSRILLVRRQDSRAVSEFVDRYRAPILLFITNAGFPEQDAEDLTQEVFLRLLNDDVLSKAERDKGKFRSFLLAVTKNLIREERRKRAAVKRGGEAVQESLDREGAADPPAPEPGEEEFDRAWVRNLLGAALGALERDNPLHHQALAAHVLEGKDYQAVADLLGKSLQDVKNYIHRSRKKLLELLQREIARYSSTAEEYEEEIRYLSRFLGPC